MSAALDTTDHTFLLEMFSSLGFLNFTPSWFSSSLTGHPPSASSGSSCSFARLAACSWRSQAQSLNVASLSTSPVSSSVLVSLKSPLYTHLLPGALLWPDSSSPLHWNTAWVLETSSMSRTKFLSISPKRPLPQVPPFQLMEIPTCCCCSGQNIWVMLDTPPVSHFLSISKCFKIQPESKYCLQTPLHPPWVLANNHLPRGLLQQPTYCSPAPALASFSICFNTASSVENKRQIILILLAKPLGLSLFLFSWVQLSHSVVSDSLRPHGLQHDRPPCPSPAPGVYSNSCSLSWWCHPTISSSIDLSPSPFSLSQQQGLFQWVSSSHQMAKVLEFQLQHQSFQWRFRTDFL